MSIFLGVLLLTAWATVQGLVISPSTSKPNGLSCSQAEHSVVGSVLLDGKCSDGNPKFKFVSGADVGEQEFGTIILQA